MSSVTIDEAIDRLNSMLHTDTKAMTELLCHRRVWCNERLADHPTCQVGAEKGGAFSLGAVGVINGIFGTDAEGIGHIAMILDEHGNLLRFQRRRKGMQDPMADPDGPRGER